jgi:hypothetical protein
MCLMSIDKILPLVHHFEERLARSSTLGRLAVVSKEKDLANLLSKLERAKVSLILATQVPLLTTVCVQCPTLLVQWPPS